MDIVGRLGFVESFINRSRSRRIVILCGDLNRDFCEEISLFVKKLGVDAKVHEIIKAKQRERRIKPVMRISRNPVLAKLVVPVFILLPLFWLSLRLIQVRVKREVIEDIEKSDSIIWVSLYEDFDVYFLVDQRIIRSIGYKHALLLKYPSREVAERINIPYEEYFVNFLNACNVPWDELKEIAEKLRDQISKGTVLRVQTQRGSDFTLYYEPSKFHAFYGLYEKSLEKGLLHLLIPEGEFGIDSTKEPLKINGKLFFDLPVILYDKIVSGVEVSVKDGYVVDYSAEKGLELLDRYFKYKDSRKVYEFGFGLNPVIKPCGSIYFDEKAYRTIHIGFSRPATPLHMDFALSNPKIYVDGYELVWY